MFLCASFDVCVAVVMLWLHALFYLVCVPLGVLMRYLVLFCVCCLDVFLVVFIRVVVCFICSVAFTLFVLL